MELTSNDRGTANRILRGFPKVMRRDRVQNRKRDVGMAVLVARLVEDGEFEHAAVLGAGLGGGASDAGKEPGKGNGDQPARRREDALLHQHGVSTALGRFAIFETG